MEALKEEGRRSLRQATLCQTSGASRESAIVDRLDRERSIRAACSWIEGAQLFAARCSRDELRELAIAQVHPPVRDRRQSNFRGRSLHGEPAAGELPRDYQAELVFTASVGVAARSRSAIGVHTSFDRGRMNLPGLPRAALRVVEPPVRHRDFAILGTGRGLIGQDVRPTRKGASTFAARAFDK